MEGRARPPDARAAGGHALGLLSMRWWLGWMRRCRSGEPSQQREDSNPEDRRPSLRAEEEAIEKELVKLRSQRFSFTAFDALLTAGLLAGGSDAVHQLLETFTGFLEETMNRIRGEARES